MTNDFFSSLIQEFGKNIGIPDLMPDENNCCCLEFDDHVVNIEYDQLQDELYLYSHIADLPQSGRKDLYELLLEGNYFFRYTNGCNLGIDLETETVALVFKIALRVVDYNKLEEILENFLHTITYWKDKITGIRHSPNVEPEVSENMKKEIFSQRV